MAKEERRIEQLKEKLTQIVIGRMNHWARKKGRAVSENHLRMCDWTLLITNVPQRRLPLAMDRAFCTVRWQIEMLFKQLKSILRG